jgi:hypothetical protein
MMQLVDMNPCRFFVSGTFLIGWNSPFSSIGGMTAFYGHAPVKLDMQKSLLLLLLSKACNFLH